ncbi:MAG: MFS transporter, partial [Bdellovibrionia bacterium]
ARMIPHQRSAEYFGLFNLVGKFASIAGPLVVALGVTVTQNPRMGMSFLIILFVMGGWLLMRVQEPAED